MGNLTDSERASPPRPLAYLLPKAIAAFIAHDCDRSLMNVPAWAATYPPSSPDDVRAAWEAQMTIKSQLPTNVGEIPEGK